MNESYKKWRKQQAINIESRLMIADGMSSGDISELKFDVMLFLMGRRRHTFSKTIGSSWAVDKNGESIPHTCSNHMDYSWNGYFDDAINNIPDDVTDISIIYSHGLWNCSYHNGTRSTESKDYPSEHIARLVCLIRWIMHYENLI